MAFPDNRILGEKYRLIRRLDGGAMGSVWLAEHVNLHSPVAIKLIAPEFAETEDGLARFFREARTAASLRNPHVVQILDYGVEEGVPYIAMELLDGEPLSERLQRVGRLSPKETEHVLRHVSRALSRAHDAGIAHRDLKPANIFIVRNEEEEIYKLLDFGIAKARMDVLTASMASNTRTGVFLGTPFYMSPEQVEGSKDQDFRADIWGMGVLAYQCLLGALPFVGDSFGSLVLSICSRPMPVPSEHGPVPAGFDAWFARACARVPAQRFQSARDAAAELRRLTEAAPDTRDGVPSVPPAPERFVDDAASLRPSSNLTETNGASSKAAPVLQGVWSSNRRALVVPAVVGIVVLVLALRSPSATPVVPASTPAVAKAADERDKTGIQISGEGGPLVLFIDGVRIGVLPLDFVELEPGERRIVVVGGARYDDYEGRVVVERGRVTRVGPIKLKVRHGLATIRAGNKAAEAAEVALEVGGSLRILPALPMQVDIDTHMPARVLAKRAGFASIEQTIHFEDGQAEKTFEIALAEAGAGGLTAPVKARVVELEEPRAEAVATLNVDSSPPSRVLLDGKLLGVTPISDIAVEPGTHEVVFIHGVHSQVKTITLDRGTVGDLAVKF